MKIATRVMKRHPNMLKLAGVLVATALLASCNASIDDVLKASAPVPKKYMAKMAALNMSVNSPLMMRIFKEENVLEVWKQQTNGRYALLAEFEICKWSGKLGPKLLEGDRQAPEGFYNVGQRQLNPKSKYYLSFNMGFPNKFDRSHGRTGSHLMIHGACSSAGCYSMTDEQVKIIYALARDSLNGGQRAFQIQAFPFRMTAENMVRHRSHPWIGFWKMLKQGYDQFEITKVPPKAEVCNGTYRFNVTSDQTFEARGKCPPMKMQAELAKAYTQQQHSFAYSYEQALAKAEGRAPLPVSPMSTAALLPDVEIESAQLLPNNAQPATVPELLPTTPVVPSQKPVVITQ